MTHFQKQLHLLSVVALALLASRAHAESWCAEPVWAHEWGVQRFGDAVRPANASEPSYFHRRMEGTFAHPSPVRDMEVDGGERELPVLQFFANGRQEIPVGVEVGFREGEATSWYPRVDERRSTADANGDRAARARQQLVALRERLARDFYRPTAAERQGLSADPHAQLVWNALNLTPNNVSLRPAERDWVRALRDVSAARWVSSGPEADRFVYYEARTQERSALRITRGEEWREGHRHIIVENTSRFDVHDIVLVHREESGTFVIQVPRIPRRSHAGFVLEEHRPEDVAAATHAHLRSALIDSNPLVGRSECVMMRRPFEPVEEATGYRLSAAEIDILLGLWSEEFFGREGTSLVYREDEASLHSKMPLSIYTDMYHYIVLKRLGLAVWRGALPGDDAVHGLESERGEEPSQSAPTPSASSDSERQEDTEDQPATDSSSEEEEPHGAQEEPGCSTSPKPANIGSFLLLALVLRRRN